MKGSTVITSRDATAVCRMIKRALIAGLASVGVNILDNQEMPLPITRHSIRASNAIGGVHVRLAPDQANMALIEIFDKQGIYLAANAQRKIETIFYREDFGRTDPDSVGSIDYMPRAIEQYSHDFFRLVNVEAIRARGFRIVVDYGYSPISSILPQMLGQMECETIALNAYTDAKRTPRGPAQRRDFLNNLSSIMVTLKSDVGVLLSVDGERMTLVDETGSIIEGDELLSVLSLLILRAHPNACIALPITMPNTVSQFLRKAGGEIERTKTDVRSLMAAASSGKAAVQFAGDTDGGFIFPEFQPAFDGLYAFVKTLEMLAVQNTTLHEIRAELPTFYTAHVTVRCAWESKGKVMRILAEESASSKVEMLDGIKVYEQDDSWALVLPDASEPVVHIFAEGRDRDQANELAHRYALRVTALRG